jgi:hypothetical protein
MPIPSPFYGSDYVVINSGATFAIGADPILNISGGYTTYVQYYKLGFGATGAFSAVSTTNPFPVTMAAGLTATISGFSGPISVTGLAGGAVNVLGTVVVSGLTSAPVYVQTAPNCRVEVTGGRYLNKLTDNVSVFGPSGSTWLYANIVNDSGVAIGTTANPMQVSFSGVTITANIASTVGVTNSPTGMGLMIQGMSGGTNVPVQIQNTVTIDDTDILSGMTAIYTQVLSLNSNLSAIGAARPSSFKTGRASSTFSSVTQVDSGGFTCQNGINIKALSTNTDFIYIGNTGSFTGSSTGYALDPGDETFLSLVNTNKVWVVAASGTQTITYMAS